MCDKAYMSTVCKTQLLGVAADVMLHVEARQNSQTQTVTRDQVCAPYAALVDLAMPNRKVVHTPTLRTRLAAGLDALEAPPKPSFWSMIGLAPDHTPSVRDRMIGGELLALALVQNRSVAAAQYGANGLRR